MTFTETESRMVVARGWGSGWESVLPGDRVSVWDGETALGMEVDAAPLGECA